MFFRDIKLPYTSLTLCKPWKSPDGSFGASDHDVLSTYESDTPTRHISLITLNVLTTGFSDFFTELGTIGDISDISPFVLPNLSIISYFKIKDAQNAINYIRKGRATAFKASYAKTCLQKQRLDDRFFICVTNKEGEFFKYMEQLSEIGQIQSVSETLVSSTKKLVSIEYDDDRDSKKVFKTLNNKTIDGNFYQVYKCEDKHSSCVCNSPQPFKNNDKVIRRPSPRPNRNSFDKVTTSSFSYFSVDPFFSSDSFSSSSESNIPDTPVSPVKEVNSPTSKKNPTCNGKSKEKSPNQIDLKKIANDEDKRTTFMIRNIPNKYSQKMLIESINKTHADTYDFIYLRMDFKNKCNVGYAFINFIEPKSVISFLKQREGKNWEQFKSAKKCSLSYATIQGKDALVRKFKNSPVMDEEESFKPKLFYSSGPNKGKEQPFVKTPPKQSRSRKNKYHRKH